MEAKERKEVEENRQATEENQLAIQKLEIKERQEAEKGLFKLRELELAERKLNEEKQIK